MSTYALNKVCERCTTPLPDDFSNLLCHEHYQELLKEQEEKEKRIKEHMVTESLKNPDSPINPEKVAPVEPVKEKSENSENSDGVFAAPPKTEGTLSSSEFGILDPNYTENPEADDKDQILANLAQFIYSSVKDPKRGKLLWYPQRNMYTYIRNWCLKRITSHEQYPKYLWKPKIVDVGSGSGVGANILSQEADFVWGIDKNSLSVQFSREAFTREKNGLYYSNQLSFDQIDVVIDTREFMKFDIVVAIEIIEHIYDTKAFLAALKRFTKRDKRGDCHMSEPTNFFISTPNRNNKKIRKDRPENPFHVREWTSQEFKGLLLAHFESVELMNDKGEAVPDDAVDQVIFAHCTLPK